MRLCSEQMLEPPHCLHTHLMRLCSQMLLQPPRCFSLHPLLWRWCGHFARFFFAASPLARLLLQVASLQLLCLAAFLGQGTLSPLPPSSFPLLSKTPCLCMASFLLWFSSFLPPHPTSLTARLLAPPPHLYCRLAHPPSIACLAKATFLTHFLAFMPDPALKLSSKFSACRRQRKPRSRMNRMMFGSSVHSFRNEHPHEFNAQILNGYGVTVSVPR